MKKHYEEIVNDDNLVDANLRKQAWAAREARVAERNELNNEGSIRLRGLARIVRSVTWGPIVNTVKGAAHGLIGLYSIAGGLGKGAIGFILNDEERKKDSVELLKAGTRAVITGAVAPVVGIFSDLYDGLHRIVTGKRAVTTLDSKMSVQLDTIRVSMDGKDKFLADIAKDAAREEKFQAEIAKLKAGAKQTNPSAKQLSGSINTARGQLRGNPDMEYINDQIEAIRSTSLDSPYKTIQKPHSTSENLATILNNAKQVKSSKGR